ncbi:MAG: CBS domain-containing protein [Desulfobacteraceae bacterium]|jgi:CBS domain-containing protein|nr:MAG: CBS domain-containing protein [Desulfobacteraceae bacterium]
MSSANVLDYDPVEISDDDVMAAMKSMKGYIDITPADFKEVYRVAYVLARERMMKALKADDIMTVPAYVVHTDTDLVATATLLAEKGISGAPVTGPDGSVVGVISERDFLREMGANQEGSFMEVIAGCLKNKGCVAAPMLKRTAGDIMTAPAFTAMADMSIGKISSLMIEKNINRVPVVDTDGKPIGIVTRSNLVNSFCMLG